MAIKRRELEMITEVLIGDRVRWDSREGTKRGEVINIFNTQDEFGDYVNFYQVEYNDNSGGTGIALVSDDEFADVDFKVIFRDINIQIARGEKVLAQ